MTSKIGRTFAGLTAIVAAACFITTSTTSADARQRSHRAKAAHSKMNAPWHGWAGGAFYLDGVRYPGGNPRGLKSTLNNWQGGFHPDVYWELLRRNSF